MSDVRPPDSEPAGPTVVVNGIRQDCDIGVWDNAFEHAEESTGRMAHCEDLSEAFAHGADWGARWMGTIIGIGTAIREREEEKAAVEWEAEMDRADREHKERLEASLRREREALRYVRDDE